MITILQSYKKDKANFMEVNINKIINTKNLVNFHKNSL